jgi:hypothetical protein
MARGVYPREEKHRNAIKAGQRKRLERLTGGGQPKLSKGHVLAGYAILREDPSTGLKFWATYNSEGSDFANLSPMQPLVFPVEKLELGTKVELYSVQKESQT